MKLVFLVFAFGLYSEVQAGFAQPIYINSAPYTISQSGLYEVTAVLTGSIAVQAGVECVTLDMKGYSIISSGTVPLNNGIVISGINSDHITIQNGFIDGINGPGISTSPYASGTDVFIKNMCISNSNSGVNIQGCENIRITNCKISNSAYGFYFDTDSYMVVDSCCVQGAMVASYYLNNCLCSCFTRCAALSMNGSQDVHGFYSFSGVGNVFNACSAQNITTSATGQNFAAGFVLNKEASTVITNCVVNGVMSLSPVVPNAVTTYGIYALSAGAPCIIQNNLVNGVFGGIYSVGIEVDSDFNFVANNISYDNALAFDYSQVQNIAANQYQPYNPDNAAY